MKHLQQIIYNTDMPINYQQIDTLNSIYKQENTFSNWFKSIFSDYTIFDDIINYSEDKLDCMLSSNINNLVQLGCSFRYLSGLYDINKNKLNILLSEDVQKALIYGSSYDFFDYHVVEYWNADKIETLLNNNVLEFFEGMTKNGTFTELSSTEVKFLMLEVNNGFKELYRLSKTIPETKNELSLFLSHTNEISFLDFPHNIFHEETQPIYERMVKLFRIMHSTDYWQETYDYESFVDLIYN